MPYPASIQSFTFKRNNVDKVVADDVNSAYTEITEIQRQLGGVASGGIGVTTSTWGTGTFVYNVSNWLAAGKDGLAQRLANIESGLYEVLATGSTFAKTNTAQTFTGTQAIAGQSTQYPVSLEIRESTHASSRRAGIVFGDVVESWTIGQDSAGDGTRDFFIFGGTTPQKARLKISPDGTIYAGNTAKIEAPYVYVVAADTQVAISTAQSNGSIGGTTTDTDTVSAFGKYISLEASSTYMVEANVMLSHSFTDNTPTVGGGSGGITFGFQYPSGTTFSLDVSQIKDQANALSNPPTVASYSDVNALLPYIYTESTTNISIRTALATAGTRYSMFRIRGIVRTSSTAGNFAPKLITTATVDNDGDAENYFISRGSILKDSFIKVTLLGNTTSAVNTGGWA
jgi:hypothetical protein